MQGGKWRTVRFPAICALLEHPTHGNIVFDTGYAPRSLEVTKTFPFQVYGKMTPTFIESHQSLAFQLKAQKNIDASEVETVILSHFHADHLGGAKDFSTAQFLYLDRAYQDVRGKTGIAALKKAYIPDLLPDDFEKRSAPFSWKNLISLPQLAPFNQGIDLFGDGTLFAILLEGHAKGQIGIYFEADELGEVLLCADACFSSQAYRENRPPKVLTNYFLSDAPQMYLETLNKLHQLYKNRPEIHILPSHCNEVLQLKPLQS